MTPSHPPFQADTAYGLRVRTEAVDRTLEQVQVILAPSTDLARRFERFAEMPEGRVTALHHTVDISRLNYRLREDVSLPLTIGYVGKISRVKGLLLLLEAVARLTEGSVRVIAYGSPSWTSLDEVVYFKQSEKLARELPVELRPEGFSPERVGEVFDDFDIFVVPSVWYENSPLVVQEAFAAGVPVVCPDEGGPAELVRHEVDGLHFRHRDVDSLTEVLKGLVDDPSRITALSRSVERPRRPGDYLDDVMMFYRKAMQEA
jgi:glycosyltransferase involved in cell wall biosynthesis